jgi:hypothetical protein
VYGPILSVIYVYIIDSQKIIIKFNMSHKRICFFTDMTSTKDFERIVVKLVEPKVSLTLRYRTLTPHSTVANCV